MVLVFHHVIIFFLLSDWLIQILPPFWFCCDVACFCFGSETQLKCTYRRCCQFFKNIVLCLDVLSGRESASMATFFFMTLLLFSRMLAHVWFLSISKILMNCSKSFEYPVHPNVNCLSYRCVFVIYKTWNMIHTWKKSSFSCKEDDMKLKGI